MTEVAQNLEHLPIPRTKTKYRPYPAYWDLGIEWLGDAPEGWDVRKLKNVTRLLYGDSLANEDRFGNDYLVYGSNGPVGENEHANTKGPCIVVGRKGSFGKINYSERPIFAIDTTYYVDERATANNIRWLFYLLNWLQLDATSKDSAVPGLSREDAYDRLVLYPPSSDQHSIANFLDEKTAQIDALIEKKQSLIEFLKEKRTALISQAVTKGLDPNAKMKDSGVEWLGNVPEGWEVKKLKYVFKNLDYKRVPLSSEERSYRQKIYPYYGASGIIDAVDEYLFDEPTILVAEDGANLLSRSTSLAFIADGKYWVNNHAHIIKPIEGPLKYWEGVLQAYDYTPLITGAAQPKLTADNLGSIFLPCPPANEQRDIEDYVVQETTKIDALIEKVQSAIDKLKEYRTALISAAVTGKIDVRGFSSREVTCQ